MGTLEEKFPLSGLLPKKETGASAYLAKYPEYDGRGVVIVIFDSGIDPGAPGLQVTSEGKVKIIERFDCSGSGDVATTTVVQPENGYLTGLTGRRLRIPSKWKNPTNSYRLGVKNAFDLYPEKLRERMQEEYKEKKWDASQRLALAEAIRQLGKFDAKFTAGQNLTDAEKLEKEDLEAKVDLLNTYEKKFSYTGQMFDCVLFHDGDMWTCCIDTSTDGNLENCPLLGEYSITHQYVPLTLADQLNVSMNVHDEGNVLELVGLASSHGTHVVSIASACFPNEPEKNGVAPGAQIISLTIGDGRLGAMETGTALVRAMIKVIELQKKYPIKVINMSYGELSHWSNTGRIGDLMNEVVNKYGIVWVNAAGNQGPALSTIGTPPDISQETIVGVGAYVSPEMMVAEYSMRKKLKGMPYTWSSRGPTIDGSSGISICAPGGAITSVPNFTLRNSQLMNGTSMASPHAAGAVAAILSGLMQRGVSFSPYNVKRALENTAQFLEDADVFAQGSGLLQVDKAFDMLVETQNEVDRDVRFHITCVSNNAKGIYIRTKPYSKTHDIAVQVEPHFLMEDSVDPSVKIGFNMKLALVCNETYVSCPKHLVLSNMPRTFWVKIDTDGLPYGVLSTKIEAYDTGNVKKGPVFKIPVTIVIPQEVNELDNKIQYKAVLFKPNTIKRHFFVVPDNATLGILQIRSTEANNKGHFVIHCLQILPKQSARSFEFNKQGYITPSSENTVHFQTRPGLVLEVVLAKFWADIGDINLDYTLTFRGIRPNHPTITMHSAEGIHSVEVTSLRGEEIMPQMQLKHSVQILKPTEAKISPLTARDIVPPGRQIYELLLVYNFHLSKQTEVSPNSSLLSNLLYESEFESQLWMLFDSNKQYLGCGDAYPSKYSLKLDKGDYTIRMQIRHDKKEYLDKLNDIPMLINQKLGSSISLDIYNSHSDAVVGGKKATYTHSTSPTTIPFYIAPLTQDKYSPKNNNPANYLTGQATFCKDEAGKKVDNYPIKYILYDNTNKKTTKSIDKEKSKDEEYKEALRDLKTSWLGKLDVPTSADALYEELEHEFPDHLQIYTSWLQSIDGMEPKRQLPQSSESPEGQVVNVEEMKKIIKVCDKVLNNVNQESLLAYFSLKNDLRSDAAKIKSQMERKKNVFIECLCRKGISLCRLYLFGQTSKEVKEDGVTMEEITSAFQTLLKFVDPMDGKVSTVHVFYFLIWHGMVYSHFGRVLKFLMKAMEEKSCREIDEKIIEICALNNWQHVVEHLKTSLPIKYPSAYRVF